MIGEPVFEHPTVISDSKEHKADNLNPFLDPALRIIRDGSRFIKEQQERWKSKSSLILITVLRVSTAYSL